MFKANKVLTLLLALVVVTVFDMQVAMGHPPVSESLKQQKANSHKAQIERWKRLAEDDFKRCVTLDKQLGEERQKGNAARATNYEKAASTCWKIQEMAVENLRHAEANYHSVLQTGYSVDELKGSKTDPGSANFSKYESVKDTFKHMFPGLIK
jgi:hypothetical protein